MDKNYLVIDKRVLPDVFDKVITAKRLLKEGKVKEITEATKLAGISRSVFYKYKDFVYEFAESPNGRKLIFNLRIAHEKGVLSSILNFISGKGGNILAIDQGIPINNSAYVTITMDISSLEVEAYQLLDELKEISGVEKVDFMAME
jgi:chorismate mutase